MTRTVTTAAPDDSIADAARLLRGKRIGALPVVEGDRVVGIVTRSDLLDYFIDLAEIEDRRGASRSRRDGVSTTPESGRRKPAPVETGSKRAPS